MEWLENINRPRRFPASTRGSLPVSLASLPCITPVREIEYGRFGGVAVSKDIQRNF